MNSQFQDTSESISEKTKLTEETHPMSPFPFEFILQNIIVSMQDQTFHNTLILCNLLFYVFYFKIIEHYKNQK